MLGSTQQCIYDQPVCLQHVHTLEEALKAMETVLQTAQVQRK